MHEPLTTTELHRLHDEAHDRAEALRRAARDDFWRGADALLGDVALRAQRAATRLAHGLWRHDRRREAASRPAECLRRSAA